ncbi:MAG: arylsulfatase [Planctomycetaceae bacterium]|nr:arylsulfatase [Planctomycetaceae bacterium]
MIRNTVLRVLTAVVGLSWLTIFLSADETQTPPNILVILYDDMGFSDLGCYGGEIETPNIDRLAESGLRFTQFYNTTRCWPTRTALMTGFYPQQVRSDPPQGKLPQGTALAPHYLQTAGYRSYHSGKWHVPGANRPCLDGGFDHSYELNDHDRNFYPQDHKEDGKPLPPVNRDDNGGYYTTTFITEKLIGYLHDHAENQPDMPFFAYAAYTAPHFPLHAPQEIIDKYRGRYLEGWDAIRQQRYDWLTKAGIINTPLSPRDENVGPAYRFDNLGPLGPDEVLYPVAWDTLTDSQKKFQTEKMAIYAAMVDCVDREVGRIIAELKRNDMFDNTAIFVLSDNGSSPEVMIRGDNHDPNAVPGSGRSFLCVGAGWSTASNTPFRLHKIWTHEGGISTPLIVHWPQGIPETMRGGLRHEPGHVIDLLPTWIDLSGASMEPNQSGLPLSGRSLLGAIQSDDARTDNTFPQRDFYFSHEGSRGIRNGWLKAVSTAEDRQGDGQWRLYDLQTDRAETMDLSAQHPEKLRELVEQWETMTQRFAEESQRP